MVVELSVTVITTWSVTAALVPSETASVKVTRVSESTAGAVKVVDSAASSERIMDRAESWVHR